MPSLIEIGPVVLEKKMKMWQVYRQTDRHTDGRTEDGQKVIRKAHNKTTITKEIGMEMKEFYEKCLGMYLTPPLYDVIPFKIIMTMIFHFNISICMNQILKTFPITWSVNTQALR